MLEILPGVIGPGGLDENADGLFQVLTTGQKNLFKKIGSIIVPSVQENTGVVDGNIAAGFHRLGIVKAGEIIGFEFLGVG